MQDETMVVLAEYNTITEAEIAKSMLDSAGIWSMIRNEYMSAIYPIGTMPAQVVVRPEDAEKARAMLQRRAVRNGAYRHRVREGHASKRVYVQVARTPFSILRGTQSGTARVR